MATDTRTYNDAIDALNSLQTPFEVIEARRKAGIRPDETSIQEMQVYLARLGHSPSDLNRLNVIHIAGTKGKGSTCAFTDSILAHHRLASPSGLPSKVGHLTSPHLIAVRERIRINTNPISEALFARYFFQVWDRLGAGASPASLPDDAAAAAVPMATRPVYARYITLLAFHTFLSEGADCVVLETGIGGEYDATNIVPSPVATGITTLGIDHVFVLGQTIDKIAWHKAGIMKPACPAAFAVEQVPEAERVLRERAAAKGVPLSVVGVDPRLAGVKIRPDARFQKQNASLAVALAEAALAKIDPSFRRREDRLPADFVQGLENVVCRGRCEVKVDEEDRVVWQIDGAHTTDSLLVGTRWFVDESRARPGPRVLVFNQQGRTEAVDFLDGMYQAAKREDGTAFDHVVFCTNVTYTTGYKKDFVNNQYDPKSIEAMSVQRIFADKWRTLDPSAKISLIPTIQEALDHVRSLSKDVKEDQTVQAFVTGSLHLVGGALSVLEGADAL
ncbi:FolC bifunctional protein [Sodiomyces alkalinus F11]|uniref:Folylpolyglutamate synthase n=1 Tax=Sodiomyces alkalinus (strain CBS 110278 / VKM F-3762 / F11) TaxID=1314773 RepID=A0A3N2PYF7_SODAK|nr:FolC bifunctional protein [Sodiomyces alkalinus F11]ROT39569.1 FolC bifunctional protein [Sodiomyces alkalinus F11]